MVITHDCMRQNNVHINQRKVRIRVLLRSAAVAYFTARRCAIGLYAVAFGSVRPNQKSNQIRFISGKQADIVSQEAQLPQRDSATRYISWNLVNCCTTAYEKFDFKRSTKGE